MSLTDREQEIVFERQANKEGGWTITPKLLKRLSDKIESEPKWADMPPSWEQIEMVLMAAEPEVIPVIQQLREEHDKTIEIVIRETKKPLTQFLDSANDTIKQQTEIITQLREERDSLQSEVKALEQIDERNRELLRSTRSMFDDRERQLRQENERLKAMLLDEYGPGWDVEFARRLSNERT